MLSKVHMHCHIGRLLGNSLQSPSLSVRGQFVYLMSSFLFGKMDETSQNTLIISRQFVSYDNSFMCVFFFFIYSLPLIHCKSLLFVGKCLEIWSKHFEYHLNVQSSVCVCLRAQVHVCVCICESVLVYVRWLILKFMDTLGKHSN